VEIGFSAVAALKTDGTIWTWGNGDSGKLGNDTLSGNRSSPGTIVGNETNWCYIGRPVDVTHAIKTDGTLWSWGINTFGQLGTSGGSTGSPVQVAGGGNNWIQVYGGGSPSSAVKTDGTLWIWGCTTGCQAMGDGTTQWKSSPVTTVGGGTNWLISGGGGAIKTDGTLWTWGLNDSGRLGDGTTTNRCSPVTTAGGGTNWCQIDLVSSASGFALKTDGTLWAWGSNANGSLGDGTTANRSSPVTTAGGGTNWCQVTFSAAMKTDGTLWTWGCGSVFGFFGGRIGDGNTADRSSPVSIGSGGTSWVQVSSSPVATVALKSV
jgi:alpha-tubulin suppressor-like RCC1 family protein